MVKRFFSLWLVMLLAVPAFSQALIQHPWKGKRVAYFGDSITDPRNSGSKKKLQSQRYLGSNSVSVTF